jgi:hypothetical protein
MRDSPAAVKAATAVGSTTRDSLARSPAWRDHSNRTGRLPSDRLSNAAHIGASQAGSLSRGLTR